MAEAGGPPKRPASPVARLFGTRGKIATIPHLPATPRVGPPSLQADFGLVANGAAELRAASIRGLSHQSDPASFRQDSYAWRATESRILLAVADGVGSASHSAVGSHIAVDTALTLAENNTCFADGVGPFVAAMLRREAALRGLAATDLATTLAIVDIHVGAATDPWRVKVAQWGDTRTCVFTPGVVESGHPRWRWPCGDEPDQVLANAVEALPISSRPTARATATFHPGEVLMVATDGVDAHLLASNSVGHGLAHAWSSLPSMPQFIADVAFDRAGARDDRTAVCIFRSAADEALK